MNEPINVTVPNNPKVIASCEEIPEVNKLEGKNDEDKMRPNKEDSNNLNDDDNEKLMDLNDQNNHVRQALLQALKAQLEYYFSPANLARDTFLRSIMIADNTQAVSSEDQEISENKLKSQEDSNDSKGKDQHTCSYAPITVLVRFGNIQKIIHLYENQRQQISFSNNEDVDEIQNVSFHKRIPNLLRDAALSSSSLKVVVISESKEIDSNAANEVMSTNVLQLGIGPTASILNELQNMQQIEAKQNEKQVSD